MSTRGYSGKDSPRKRTRSIPIEEIPSDTEDSVGSESSYGFMDEDEESTTQFQLGILMSYDPVIEEPREDIEQLIIIEESENTPMHIIVRNVEYMDNDTRGNDDFDDSRGDREGSFNSFVANPFTSYFEDFDSIFTDFNRMSRNMNMMRERMRQNFERFGGSAGSFPGSRFRRRISIDEVEPDVSKTSGRGSGSSDI